MVVEVNTEQEETQWGEGFTEENTGVEDNSEAEEGAITNRSE